MEMTFDGDNVSGKITNKAKPTDTLDIPSWPIKTPENRKTGFVGITASTGAGLTVQYDNFEVIVGGKQYIPIILKEPNRLPTPLE